MMSSGDEASLLNTPLGKVNKESMTSLHFFHNYNEITENFELARDCIVKIKSNLEV